MANKQHETVRRFALAPKESDDHTHIEVTARYRKGQGFYVGCRAVEVGDYFVKFALMGPSDSFFVEAAGRFSRKKLDRIVDQMAKGEKLDEIDPALRASLALVCEQGGLTVKEAA